MKVIDMESNINAIVHSCCQDINKQIIMQLVDNISERIGGDLHHLVYRQIKLPVRTMDEN